MICQSCGLQGETRYVRFHQHIGAVVMMFNRWIKGNFCRRCGMGYFKKYMLITGLFGWWGLISFFLTPIFLLMNLFYAARLLGLPDGGMMPPAGTPPALPPPIVPR
jgi:hypothetical protein